jgi:TOTE conflict system, Archaeo-Eukaryotic Primase domain/ParD-like antitoxin of type II bacterial toxin-antitoxin system
VGMPVRIDDSLYERARAEAQIEHRTIAGQIEFWAMVGRAALDNPVLPVSRAWCLWLSRVHWPCCRWKTPANTRCWKLTGLSGVCPPVPVPHVSAQEPSRSSTGEKVELFRRLFRGRTDVYPVRWESKTTGKTGYAPACGNEWLAGICGKPRIKCADCNTARGIAAGSESGSLALRCTGALLISPHLGHCS